MYNIAGVEVIIGQSHGSINMSSMMEAITVNIPRMTGTVTADTTIEILDLHFSLTTGKDFSTTTVMCHIASNTILRPVTVVNIRDTTSTSRSITRRRLRSSTLTIRRSRIQRPVKLCHNK